MWCLVSHSFLSPCAARLPHLGFDVTTPSDYRPAGSDAPHEISRRVDVSYSKSLAKITRYILRSAPKQTPFSRLQPAVVFARIDT